MHGDVSEQSKSRVPLLFSKRKKLLFQIDLRGSHVLMKRTQTWTDGAVSSQTQKGNSVVKQHTQEESWLSRRHFWFQSPFLPSSPEPPPPPPENMADRASRNLDSVRTFHVRPVRAFLSQFQRAFFSSTTVEEQDFTFLACYSTNQVSKPQLSHPGLSLGLRTPRTTLSRVLAPRRPVHHSSIRLEHVILRHETTTHLSTLCCSIFLSSKQGSHNVQAWFL